MGFGGGLKPLVGGGSSQPPPAGLYSDTQSVWYNDFVFRARATVELLHASKTPNFLAPNLWPPNSSDLSPVDYEIWTVMQHCVYHRQIHSVECG